METTNRLEKTVINVPVILTESQVKSYVDDGFVVVENMLDLNELNELKGEAVKFARGQYPVQGLPELPDNATGEQALASILCIHQAHHVSDIVLKYVMHEKISGVLGQITAAHLAHWDGSVKCMQSMFFVKPPQFQGQAWHQDEIYIPTRDRSLVGAWIAIDDASIENGCLWVIPGSHRNGYLYSQQSHDNYDEFDSALTSYGFDASKEIPVEVKAGAVVFFNGHLLHRSQKNRSNIYRRVLVSHYMNAWSQLPWHAVDKEGNETARSDVREGIIPIAGQDPYAWRGYGENNQQHVSLRTCKANDPNIENKEAKHDAHTPK